MNRENYLESVAALCRVDVNEIVGKTQAQLVNDFILPRGVEPTGQDTRGWRISPQFMQFMADWGQYCVAENRASGELLMEIALQRLSKGAIIRELHGEETYRDAQKVFDIVKGDDEKAKAKKAKDLEELKRKYEKDMQAVDGDDKATRKAKAKARKELEQKYEKEMAALQPVEGDDEATKERKRKGYEAFHIQYHAEHAEDIYAPYNPHFALPEGYRQYSNWYDQPGLMSQECWNFFKANIYWCMTEMSDPVWKGHARKLCVGLIQHISCDGEELGGYMWNEDLVKEPLKAAYQFAEDCACRVFGVQKVAKLLLPTWRDHKWFFKKYEWEIDFPALFKDWGEDEPGLDVEKEGARYYGKKTRWFLKLIRRYKGSVEAKVKAEMMASVARTAVVITAVGGRKYAVQNCLKANGYNENLAEGKMPKVVNPAMGEPEAQSLADQLMAAGAEVELI